MLALSDPSLLVGCLDGLDIGGHLEASRFGGHGQQGSRAGSTAPGGSAATAVGLPESIRMRSSSRPGPTQQSAGHWGRSRHSPEMTMPVERPGARRRSVSCGTAVRRPAAHRVNSAPTAAVSRIGRHRAPFPPGWQHSLRGATLEDPDRLVTHRSKRRRERLCRDGPRRQWNINLAQESDPPELAGLATVRGEQSQDRRQGARIIHRREQPLGFRGPLFLNQP